MNYPIKKVFLLASVLAVVLLALGCQKDTTNYELTVKATVYDTVNVSNALIRVYAPVKDSYLDYYQSTDENGETVFNIDRKAVVEIVGQKGSFKTCTFKELFNGGNSVTINLLPFATENNGCP